VHRAFPIERQRIDEISQFWGQPIQPLIADMDALEAAIGTK
jgi:hypothetical protein